MSGVPSPIPNPVYANVAYFRIPRFDALSVAEQASLKQALEARLREAMSWVPPQDRVVLDADEGAALVLFGDPARALDVAQAVHAREPIHAGLNYGPLALSSRGTDAKVFGDGLVGAAAAARFSTPEKLLVTHDYAQGPRGHLAGAGERARGRGRVHRHAGAPALILHAGCAARCRAAAQAPDRRAAGGVIAILFAGVILREGYQRVLPAARRPR